MTVISWKVQLGNSPFKSGQRADYFYRPLLQQKRKSDICRISFINSGDGGTWTHDLYTASVALSQLSYAPIRVLVSFLKTFTIILENTPRFNNFFHNFFTSFAMFFVLFYGHCQMPPVSPPISGLFCHCTIVCCLQLNGTAPCRASSDACIHMQRNCQDWLLTFRNISGWHFGSALLSYDMSLEMLLVWWSDRL